MADDKLVLTAELVDKYSGALRDMTKATHAFQDILKGSHTEGSKAAKEHDKAQKELRERFEQVHEFIEGSFGPSLEALGIEFGAVTSAAVGFSKIIESVKKAGESYYSTLNAVARTGFDVNELKSRVMALESFGISADTAQSSLVALGDSLARLRRLDPNELQRWAHVFPNLNELQERIKKAKDLGESIDTVIEFVYKNKRIPPDQRAKFLGEILHLPPDIAEGIMEGYAEALEKTEKYVKQHPGISLPQLKEIHEQFEGLERELKGIGEDVTRTFAGPVTEALKVAIALVKDFNIALHQAYILATFKPFSESYDTLKKRLKEAQGDTKPEDWLGKSEEGEDDSFRWMTPEEELKMMRQNPNLNPRVRIPKNNPLFHQESFSEGDLGSSSSDAETMLSRSVKSGMLAAFQEWFASVKSPGGGVQNASFGPAGSGASAAARGWGGGGYHVVPEGSTDEADAGDNGPPVGSLAEDRKRFADEIAKNPRLKHILFGQSYGENNNPLANQAVMEEIMNRASNRHQTLAQSLGIGAGLYEQGWNPRYPTALMEHNLAKVLSGSNVSLGATDNSSGGLAMRERANGKYKYRRTINGESFFTSEGWGTPKFGRTYPKWAADRGLDPATGQARDLLDNAQKAGMGGKHTVEGNANLNVQFDNAPPGAKAYMKYGGMFKSGSVDWGHPMSASDPGGHGDSFRDRWNAMSGS